MFQFPGLASFRMIGLWAYRVAPFGNPRIYTRLQLPEA